MTEEARALARVRYEEALARRDAICRRLVEQITPALGDLSEFDSARKSLDEAHASLRRLGAPVPELPQAPLERSEAWRRLVTLVAPLTDAGLTEELVDAAARSPLGHAIDDLPLHLRGAARERRKVLLRHARTRRRVALGAGARRQP